MEHIFRQWDDKFCRFTYWGVNIPMSLYLQTVGYSLHEGEEDSPRQAFTEPSKDGVGSEQYTGIRDIDQKHRIFVGDKVRVEWLADIGIEEFDCECVGVVKFHDGKFVVWFEPEYFKRVACADVDCGIYSMQFIELTSDHHDENVCLSFEVIGHIHEEVPGHAE